jgi:hypothetical protein
MFIYLYYFPLLIDFNQFTEFTAGLYAFALQCMYVGRICWLLQASRTHRGDHIVFPLHISYIHQFPAEELTKP